MHRGHHLLWNWYLQNQQMQVGLRMTHTHSLGNHSSHGNKDSFSHSKEDFPAFHCNTGSIKEKNDIYSILLYTTIHYTTSGAFRSCAKK